ncbi:hypothetical protein HELRODRAFT_159228 [Helobdella robusta]|uniref:Endonuclease/exonuclease/phosphatase domain-containing protein n=1 Tax=Helobdella robusta TaxID=6412 RepID=T1ENR8_HELRO|nr:hypothetical protein HELRODRAFT_159228 [Helobdella robusta]ESO12652.1 hypothetical protein HELRODRAFT_159228 [Helobdella robusta]
MACRLAAIPSLGKGLGVNPVKNLARIVGYEDKTAPQFHPNFCVHTGRSACLNSLCLLIPTPVEERGDKAALFRDALLSPTGEGTKKSVLKKASQYVADLCHERRSAIVARELARYDIDVAALSETRISAATQFEERGAGYTFFCQGHPAGEVRTGGVGFAIRSTLLKSVHEVPYGISPRLMRMQLNLEGGHTATLISCYAPTLGATFEEKSLFYEQLDHILWPKVLGRNGVGRENSNGTMLLEFCTEHNLVVTNTVFQQADRKKTSWKHPRSGHWHLIDYILIRQRDLRLARLTTAVRASTMWSDHRLIKMSVFLTVKPVRRHHKTVRKANLDVTRLTEPCLFVWCHMF